MDTTQVTNGHTGSGIGMLWYQSPTQYPTMASVTESVNIISVATDVVWLH